MGLENNGGYPGCPGSASYQMRDSDFVPDQQQQRYPDLPSRAEKRSGSSYAPWYHPRGWGKKAWAIALAVLAIVLIVIIIPAVVVTRANRYPDYTKLNYSLQDDYSGEGFFDKFDYFTGYDPTQGFVHYVPKEQAAQLNLTYATSNSAVIKVDTSVGPGSQPDASTGRFSVRLESKKQYNSGLFIFDVKHAPYGCGTWPALWLTDPNNWPNNGEIDIMESTNQGTDGNLMTLHTSDGCDMDVKRLMSGSVAGGTCYNGEGSDNQGCGVKSPTPAGFGAQYNSAQGGVTAVEWRAEGIRIWEFPRAAVPADVAARKPDPSSWGQATADFPSTSCDMGSHFRNQSIIANIDLCGALAGATYGQSGCPSTCSDFVAKNPKAFNTAFWEFGSFQVYKAS